MVMIAAALSILSSMVCVLTDLHSISNGSCFGRWGHRPRLWWLQKFAFTIDVGPWPFAVAVLFTLTVTVVAVSAHAIQVALANPTESLRNE